jgi:hypothetical protein
LQTVAANSGQTPIGSFMRYLQIQLDFGSVDTVQNEISTLAIYGSHWAEF